MIRVFCQLLIGIVCWTPFSGLAQTPKNALTEQKPNTLVWVSVAVSSDNTLEPKLRFLHKQMQGDAHLISADKKNFLIDGGEITQAKEILLPFLKQNNITRLDRIFISHPHFDHYGGVIALLETNFDIGEIYWTETSDAECEKESPWGCRVDELKRLKELSARRKVPLKNITTGFSEMKLGDLGKLEKIAQFSKKTCPVPCDLNDTSLIAKLTVGSSSALFTGDLNESLSKWLVETKPKEIAATILKAPHHGTDGAATDEFYRAVNAKTIVVPTYYELWCSDRSARMRRYFTGHGAEVVTSGTHGNVFITFEKSGAYRVTYDGLKDLSLTCKAKSKWWPPW